MKLQIRNSIFVSFCALFIAACGGGGGAGSGSVGQSAGAPSTGEVREVALNQEVPIEYLPFEKLKKYFPAGNTVLEQSDQDAFIKNYLADVGETLSEDQKKVLKEKLFGDCKGTYLDMNVEAKVSEHISKEILDKLPTIDDIKNLDQSVIDSGNIDAVLAMLKDKVKLNEAEMVEFKAQKAELFNDLPQKAGYLDANSDCKLDFKDFIKVIVPTHKPGISAEEIKKHYMYWSYFVDVKEKAFKDNMWPNGKVQPPIMGIVENYDSSNKKVIILDFRGKLALEGISVEKPVAHATKHKYVIHKDILNEASAYWKTIYTESLGVNHILIDKVVIVHSAAGSVVPRSKILFYVKDNIIDLDENAVRGPIILTARQAIEINKRKKKRAGLMDSFVTKAYAGAGQVAIDATTFLADLDKKLIEFAFGESGVESEPPSQDFMKANFEPPMPVDAMDEFTKSKDKMNEQMASIKIKFDSLLSNAADIEGNNGYNDENGCELTKLSQLLHQLETKQSDYYRHLILVIMKLEDDLKDLEDKYHTSLRAGTSSQDQSYFMFLTIAAVASALEMVVGAFTKAVRVSAKYGVQLASEAFIREMAKEGKSELAGYAMGRGIQAVALLLKATTEASFSMLEKLLGKQAYASMAAVNPVFIKMADMLITVSKVFLEGELSFDLKVSKVVQGLNLIEAISVGAIKSIVEEAYQKAINAIENKIATYQALLEYQRQFIFNYKKFHQFVLDKNGEVRNMAAQVQLTMTKSATHQIEKKEQCEVSYIENIANLKDSFEQNKQSEKYSLDSFESDYSSAYEKYKKYSKDCDQASEKGERGITDFDQLGCAGADAPAFVNFMDSGKDLKEQREIVKESITQLELQFHEDLSQLKLDKEACLEGRDPSCNAKIEDLVFDTSDLQAANAALPIDDGSLVANMLKELDDAVHEEPPSAQSTIAPLNFTNAKEEIDKLSIKGPSQLSFYPTNGKHHCSEMHGFGRSFVIFNEGTKLIGYEEGEIVHKQIRLSYESSRVGAGQQSVHYAWPTNIINLYNSRFNSSKLYDGHQKMSEDYQVAAFYMQEDDTASKNYNFKKIKFGKNGDLMSEKELLEAPWEFTGSAPYYRDTDGYQRVKSDCMPTDTINIIHANYMIPAKYDSGFEQRWGDSSHINVGRVNRFVVSFVPSLVFSKMNFNVTLYENDGSGLYEVANQPNCKLRKINNPISTKCEFDITLKERMKYQVKIEMDPIAVRKYGIHNQQYDYFQGEGVTEGLCSDLSHPKDRQTCTQIYVRLAEPHLLDFEIQ